MKRKFALLLAFVLTLCLFVTACGDDGKSKKEELEELQEEIEELEEELDELKTQESTLKSEINEVTVPKFIGKMYYTEIENNMDYDHNFNLFIKWEEANNPDTKKGEVFKQEPAAGKKVKKGATVTLYVNSATPKDITLDVRAQLEGEPKNDVRKLLQDAGFVVSEITSSSEDVPADHVIKVEGITSGQTTYPYGTKVTMVISSGPSTPTPIDFPAEIVGKSKEIAASILKSRGFKGTITFVEQNYNEDAYAEKGIVMGVIINGLLQEALPEEITADGVLMLAVSSGLKSVAVELEWPNAASAIDVRVKVGGTVNAPLSSQYVGIIPQHTADKLSFVITDHPREGRYTFSVEIKKHDAPDEDYKLYAAIVIDSLNGTWTMVNDYQSLPGITE